MVSVAVDLPVAADEPGQALEIAREAIAQDLGDAGGHAPAGQVIQRATAAFYGTAGVATNT